MEICTTQRKISFLLLTGIPLFLPIVAFISVKILAWKTSSKSPSTTKVIEIDEEAAEDLYRRKIELELQFVFYQDQKDREIRLLQINNQLFLEKTMLELRSEIGSLKSAVDQLEKVQKEQTELLKKTESIASALSAKDDEIGKKFVSKEDNDYVVKQLLRVEEELRNMGRENTHLIRSDLARLKQEIKNDDHHPGEHCHERVHGSEDGIGNNIPCRKVRHLSSWIALSPLPNNDNASSSGSEITVSDHPHESKTERLIKRIKGLVDGKKSVKHRISRSVTRSATRSAKRSATRSATTSDAADHHYSPPRYSFSSV